MLEVVTTALAGVLVLTPKRFGDARGFFSEVYSRQRYRDAGVTAEFIQDNHSYSGPAGTVRGLHFQRPPFAQAKLVRVLRGVILDVVVDLRRGSPTYGRHVAVPLSAADWNQLFVPAGFAHGFCTLEPDTEVFYKVDAYYSAEHDGGILWNDPALGIDWPVAAEAALLSDKDRKLPLLKDLGEIF